MKHTKFITISSSLLLGSSMLSQAASTLPGADFTLSTSTAAGPVHDNLPAAFGDQIAVGGITPTTNSNFGGIFDISNLSDGNLARANNASWASGQDASVSVTLTWATSTDIAGLAFNWAWDDRDEGVYEVLINGTISQGSFTVDTGTDLSTESPALNTYVIFDSAQIGVTSVQINMSGSSQYGLDELEVYSAVPEPSSAALLGLGGLALILRRRK